MKTKLYTLISGLLMAACVTSYGQEIVSDFYYTFGKAFTYNDLVICSDGSIISGIFCYNASTYNDEGFHVCKFSPDGQLLDSVTFASAWELYDIPCVPDTFFLPDYTRNVADSILGITMTFIDADLNIINTVSTPILSGFDPQTFEEDAMCVASNGDLIATFWVDETFYLARVGLNGTLEAFEAAPGILPYDWTYTHPAGSALNYQSFGVFNESPERFYKIGGYIAEENEPCPVIAYLFDADLNLTDTIKYGYLDGVSYCEFGTREHIVHADKTPFKESYFMAACIHSPEDYYQTSLIRYDMNNNAVAFTMLESPSSVLEYPINTIVTGDNIYHTYETYPNGYYNPTIKLARLDENLNILWKIELPQVANAMTYGTTLKALPNGDIAVSMASYRNYSTRLYIFIIRDNDPTGTPEIVAAETPFTLYPNPVKDLLTLRFDDGAMPESVELYDLAGRLVGTKPNGLESIDMGTMSSGVYILRVTMKDGTCYHEKLVKR